MNLNLLTITNSLNLYKFFIARFDGQFFLLKFLAKKFFRGIITIVSGFSAVWSARLPWEQKVVSSNLTTPTIFFAENY